MRPICFCLFVSFILYTPTFGQDNFVPFYYGTCVTAFEGNPLDCTTYFQCNFGRQILRQCPPGLQWNPDITACDWPRNLRSGTCAGQEIQEADSTISSTPQPNELDFGPEEEDTVVIGCEQN